MFHPGVRWIPLNQSNAIFCHQMLIGWWQKFLGYLRLMTEIPSVLAWGQMDPSESKGCHFLSSSTGRLMTETPWLFQFDGRNSSVISVWQQKFLSYLDTSMGAKVSFWEPMTCREKSLILCHMPFLFSSRSVAILLICHFKEIKMHQKCLMWVLFWNRNNKTSLTCQQIIFYNWKNQLVILSKASLDI